MNKYKLINNKTKEESVCEIVEIDGFQYYINDEEPTNFAYIIHKNEVLRVEGITECGEIFHNKGFNKPGEYKNVVATTNLYADIPKAISESVLIYSLANNLISHLTFPGERAEGIIQGYNAAKETYSFTDRDADEYADAVMAGCLLRAKEWKEQQPKVIYYA